MRMLSNDFKGKATVIAATSPAGDVAGEKAYIKTHNRRPGIPTQPQVEKDGIHLAEMNTKLLEKAEELTLYMLKQHEEISTLKAMSTKQMALIQALEKRI